MLKDYRPSAHIGYLFTELPLRERFLAAKEHGFCAVEHPSPYAIPADDVAACLEKIGLSYTQMGLQSGDASRGEKGIAIFPDRRAEFRESVAKGLDYAERVGAGMVHAMAGVLPVPMRSDDHWNCYIENLSYAATAAGRRGMTILVEAMSAGAVPDYFIDVPDRAAEAIRATGCCNIRLLFDVFHAVNSGLDVDQQIGRHADLIAHVHIADHPGRHEPGSGRIDFLKVAQALADAGYRGVLGYEYNPQTTTEEGLGWLKR